MKIGRDGERFPDSRTPRRLAAASATRPTMIATPLLVEGQERRDDVVRAGGDRHRHGHHVVEQGAGHGQSRELAVVLHRDLVVAAPDG